jgi:hypothetical protein
MAVNGMRLMGATKTLKPKTYSDAFRYLKIDTTTHTLQTIDYAHHEIHSGSHYFVVGYQDLSINQVLDFTWQIPDTAKWIHWVWQIYTESETIWQVYEGVTATNPLANSITPLNSNRNSTNTSGTTMLYEVQTSLANANADTDVSGATLIKSGIAGSGNRGAGFAGRESEVILKQNTLYGLRAIASAAGYINFDMEWYEHEDKT